MGPFRDLGDNQERCFSMKRGENRAELIVKLKWLFDVFEKKQAGQSVSGADVCIFISHTRQDTESCIPIAEYLCDAGIDIYFDHYDPMIDELVQQGNADKVAAHIQEGIEYSSHMICVVSPQTVNSYWVPFEVGYGYGKIPLAVLTLKGLAEDALPEYMRTTRVIRGTLTLNAFIAELLEAEVKALENGSVITKHSELRHALDDVLDWRT